MFRTCKMNIMYKKAVCECIFILFFCSKLVQLFLFFCKTSNHFFHNDATFAIYTQQLQVLYCTP